MDRWSANSSDAPVPPLDAPRPERRRSRTERRSSQRQPLRVAVRQLVISADADAAASVAASPAFSACGERVVPNGLLHQLMAIPQWAIAQFGSACSTFENDSMAAENQNECSRARPRSSSS
mgnify:CR=1 FL=1